MKTISELKNIFDSLDINESNISLYESLFILDISEYLPLMTEILDGRLDIEDLRSYFNKYNNSAIPKFKKTTPLFIEMEDVVSATVSNLKLSLFGNQSIKEGFLPTDDTDLKYKIAAELKENENITLNDVEINAIITGMDPFKIISTDLNRGITKEEQLFASNILSPKITGEL